MSVGRIIGVTVLLAALVGLAGATGGAVIALGLLAVAGESPNSFVLSAVLRTAGTVGFIVGVLAGPALSWTLLRHAPIWRAIGETALAAGLAASLSLGLEVGFWAMIGASVIGATLAALRLRRVTRSPIPSQLPNATI